MQAVKYRSFFSPFFSREEERIFRLTSAITGVFFLVIANTGAKLNLPFFQGLVSYVLCGLGAILCLFGLHVNRVRKPIENVEPARINNKKLILNWINELDHPYGPPACHIVPKNEEGQENSYLYHLCDELLVSLFSLLDPITLVRVSLTSTKFYNLLQDKDLHRRIDLFHLAKTILHPLSNQPYCFNSYFTALMCAKVAKYFLSIHLTDDAYNLADNVKEMIEQERSPKRKYKLSSKLPDFHLDLPLSTNYDLEIMEKIINEHYSQKTVSHVVIQHIKCIFFHMIAKVELKKMDYETSSRAIKRAMHLFKDCTSRRSELDDPHLMLSTWRSHAKGLIHANDFKRAQILLEKWPFQGATYLEGSYNKYMMLSLWIDLAVQLFQVRHNQADIIFKQIEEIIFHNWGRYSSKIGNALTVRLGVDLACAKAQIGDMEGCKQILIKAVNMWDETNHRSFDIYRKLAKISLLMNPNNITSISNLTEHASHDQKAQIRILLKALSYIEPF